MEVNRHSEINMFGGFRIIKNPNTMDYNVDSTGQTIPFGAAGYDPVVIEIAGDAVTLTEYMEKSDLRLLGIWDSAGNYHDLQQAGHRPRTATY